MMSTSRLDVHPLDRYDFAGFHLDDPAKAVPRQKRSRAARRKSEVIPAQPPQRRQVKMVGMKMGEEHDVKMRQIEVRNRRSSRQMADASGQQRVGQQPKPV
jgi:hypothetical protein